MNSKYYISLLFLLIGFQFKVYSQDESFETAVPSWWSTTSGSTLSTSSDHYKHGTQSLQWDWTGNSIIEVADVQNHGYSSTGIQSKRFFRLWVYNTVANPTGNLKIAFLGANGLPLLQYTFNLNFTGWRAAGADYSTEMGYVSNQSLDIRKIKITAPSSGNGTFYLDNINYIFTPITQRAQDYQFPNIVNTGGDLHWEEMMKYQALPKTIPLATPTSTELSDLAIAKAKYDAMIKGGAPNTTAVTTATNQYNAAGIGYDSNTGIVKGIPLFGKDFPDTQNLQVVENFLLVFARDYKFTSSTTSKDYFLNAVRYFLDQGYADGSLMETLHHIGYSFRNIPQAIHLMKDELVTAGLWDQAQKMVEWYSAVDGIWSPNASDSNMDDGNTRTIARLGACLYKTTDEEKVQYLKGFKKYLETFLDLNSNSGLGMRVDYTGFHHFAFYPGYSFPSNSVLSQAINYISDGSFAISATAHASIRKSVLLSRVMGETSDIGNSLSGRNPFTNVNIRNGLKNLGLANPISTDLLKAYNYNYPGDATTASYGVETPPKGFWQVNFAGLGVYRQATWLADIKGFNKNFWGTEIYATNNRYGRYQSYGAIEIIYPGGNANSLININGYDWNKPPGTTTKHLSDANLVAANSLQDETTDSNFASSLRFGTKANYYIDQKIEGDYGVFGMDFTQRKLSTNHDTSFKFKKSVFCFDGKLICLGSTINSTDVTNLIATNLFQNYLGASTAKPIIINNTTEASFPYNSTLPNTNSNWIIDAAGTGYYVKRGNSVVIDRKNQISQSQTGNGTTTTGNFVSAYISHGIKPLDAGYEFVIIPQTTATDMSTFSTTMDATSAAFYQVLQKDSNAHIVKYNDMYGYSLFASNGNFGTATPIQSNSAPCLVMTKENGTDLALSFVNPDMNFASSTGPSQASPVAIKLNGTYTIISATGGVVNATTTNGATTLSIQAQAGLPVDIALQKSTSTDTSDTKVFYYEDFSSNTNGILTASPAIVTTITTYPGVRRVTDIPDYTDSNAVFDSGLERPATVIPRGVNRTNSATAALSLVGTNANVNYTGDVYVVFPTINMTAANPLIPSANIYKYASFWSERRYGDGDIATAEILVTTNYSTIAGTTWTTVPLLSGKLATTADGLTYVNGLVDLSTYANGANGTTVTLALRYKCSNSTYSGTNRNGTFYFSDLKFYSQSTPTLATKTWNKTTSEVLAVKNQEVYQVIANGVLLKEITIYDIQGHQIFKQININSDSSTLAGLPTTKGVLIVKVITNTNQTSTIKIIN